MTLSAAAKAALFGQQTDQVFLALLKIEHDDLAAPICVVNNYTDITSGSDLYSAFPFRVQLLSDQDENLPEAVLQIDNVDRSIVNAVRTITSAPTVTLSVVLAATPDTVEYGPIALTLRNVSWDALTVSGKLAVDPAIGKRFPGERMTPNLFRGLF